MIRRSIPMTLLGMLASGTAHAADAPTEGTWGVACWVFAGYCSLVVVPQALRAFRYLLFPGEKTGKNADALKTP